MTLIVNDKRAVLTAITPNFWGDFKLFLHSLRLHCDYKLYVICIGLHDEYIEFLNRQPNVYPIIYNCEDINNCSQWSKPFYFSLVPDNVEYILWIDADTIINKPINEIFDQLSSQFVIVYDYFAPNTCLNNSEIYDIYNIDIEEEYKHVAVNTGVVGFNRNRIEDREIITEWQEITKEMTLSSQLRSLITLYDQGVFLLVIHKLRLYNNILHNVNWNYPAKRNPYNLYENVWKGTKDSIGGDLIDNIAYDNPGAVIIHYAGLPKLSNLLFINDMTTRKTLINKRGVIEPRRIFVIGLERSGTHTIAEALRKSAKSETWVRHEYREVNRNSGISVSQLAQESYNKYNNLPYLTHSLSQRLKLYSRTDCSIICESNHRLAFFISDINETLDGNCHFILSLRDPVQLIRSRLHNFSLWVNRLGKYPICYQQDSANRNLNKFKPLSSDFNIYRISPADDLSILDMHIWEIEETLKYIKSTASKSGAMVHTVWIDNYKSVSKLLNYICRPNLNIDNTSYHLSVKYGRYPVQRSEDTIKWIEELVDANSKIIRDRLLPAYTLYTDCSLNFI